MTEKAKKCSTCGNNSFIGEMKSQHLAFKNMEMVLRSLETPYEKKIALFKCLKDIEVGELEPEQKERIDFLIQSRLYAELAKQSMKDEIKKELVEKYYFNEELIKLEPVKEEIILKSTRDIVYNTDLYYYNEKAKFLFLLEAKRKISQHNAKDGAIDDIKKKRLERLQEFWQKHREYKIVGLAFSGKIKSENRISTFIVNKAGKIEEKDEEVDKKARIINKKLTDETVLTPQRIALIAGIFI
ncbi:10534_t:CDS:2, partial [Funneliformis geosporum]